jgi:hypothetical protein
MDDVVFAQITSRLNPDDFQWHIGELVFIKGNNFAPAGDFGDSSHHGPSFDALVMSLNGKFDSTIFNNGIICRPTSQIGEKQLTITSIVDPLNFTAFTYPPAF